MVITIGKAPPIWGGVICNSHSVLGISHACPLILMHVMLATRAQLHKGQAVVASVDRYKNHCAALSQHSLGDIW